MMFDADQIKALSAPLARSHVKGRNQGGRQVSYIEGWHVIAEANRIFGFDAWSRETVEIKCVSEREREIGANKSPGWGVTYICRVRVRVGNEIADVIRDGCGSGHGIDKDLGQAHESAIKEAETDAMKRAFMTFGNPFGLALYDKSQENVADPVDESVSSYIEQTLAKIAGATDGPELRKWWANGAPVRRQLALTNEQVADLMTVIKARLEAIEPKKDAA